jgi:hypothetical protein
MKSQGPRMSAPAGLLCLLVVSGAWAQVPPAPPTQLRIASSSPTVTLGAWRSTESLTSFSPGGAHDSASVAWNGYFYVTGGQYGAEHALDRIQRAEIRSDGSLGPWLDMATLSAQFTLPIGRQDHKAVVYAPTQGGDAFIYIVGGWESSSGARSDVYHAKLMADGTFGPWIQGPSLNTPRHGHEIAIVNGRLYAFGGWDSFVALDGVEYVEILPDGSLQGNQQGKWFVTQPLPQTLNFPAGGPYGNTPGASYSPRVYSLGGENPDLCGETVQKAVYSATPESDGSIRQWRFISTMPAPLFDHAATFYQNSIIVTGGSLRRSYSPVDCTPWGAVPQTSVYIGSVEQDGSISGWASGPDLPAPRGDHTAVLYDGFLYIIGGRSTSDDPPYSVEVWYAPLRLN